MISINVHGALRPLIILNMSVAVHSLRYIPTGTMKRSFSALTCRPHHRRHSCRLHPRLCCHPRRYRRRHLLRRRLGRANKILIWSEHTVKILTLEAKMAHFMRFCRLPGSILRCKRTIRRSSNRDTARNWFTVRS